MDNCFILDSKFIISLLKGLRDENIYIYIYIYMCVYIIYIYMYIYVIYIKTKYNIYNMIYV